ncbi:MAG TPA: cytochrome P450 [Amaricoccus sp.]|uniref:cytochrome P450 n=1 Tax=Amaricoccus sp. TaxID=1872485 RepID=UPI001E118E09|nr:cytochrome P450 [Amaricoccus sp.]MCB1372893.1 cytochrome P450 [Paracoccaceae bacterium]MCB1402099.1 cytochrome P450 [Paracoccaceae bacterium]HPG21511.1 cytochrome P450 [Amaricoccus sp.]HRW14457.1 cytochrome P450 [Amaricoccus sp.]
MNQHVLDAFDSPLRVDPAALMDDPHAAFAALRPEHPVIRLGEKLYLALRAQEVLSLLTDPRTVQVEGPDYVALKQIPDGAAARFLTDLFLFSNDEAHRAKRGLFARAFAHGAMRAARVQVRGVAETIVADLPRGESFDFVERMAARVPAEMIAAILGLPRSDARHFAPRVYDLARALTPVYPLPHHAAIEAAAGDLFAYVEDHLRLRLEEPGDDLLSRLAADWRANQAISFDSLVHQILGILVGGSDTTRAAFAMLVALLLERPRDWAAVRADPGLVPGAVAEAMRYEPSVGTIARFTTAPLEVGGLLVPAGVMLSVSTLSAMRDPALYADPGRFDIRRADHPRLHPVFGLGPHRCIGEMLARIEMEEGLAALASDAPDIRMEERPRMLGFGGIRQITPMRVRIR